MTEEARPILDYMGHPVRRRAPINVAAIVSLVCGATALLFLMVLCLGMWRHMPFAGINPGLIEMPLGAVAVIAGGMGALHAPRESRWYGISLSGYAAGVFVWTLCPVFFML